MLNEAYIGIEVLALCWDESGSSITFGPSEMEWEDQAFPPAASSIILPVLLTFPAASSAACAAMRDALFGILELRGEGISAVALWERERGEINKAATVEAGKRSGIRKRDPSHLPSPLLFSFLQASSYPLLIYSFWLWVASEVCMGETLTATFLLGEGNEAVRCKEINSADRTVE